MSLTSLISSWVRTVKVKVYLYLIVCTPVGPSISHVMISNQILLLRVHYNFLSVWNASPHICFKDMQEDCEYLWSIKGLLFLVGIEDPWCPSHADASAYLDLIPSEVLLFKSWFYIKVYMHLVHIRLFMIMTISWAVSVSMSYSRIPSEFIYLFSRLVLEPFLLGTYPQT